MELTKTPAESRGALKVNSLADHVTSEHRTCEDSKSKCFCSTVASDLTKSATDNHLEGEAEHSEVLNNTENEESGICKTLPGRESHTEREDPTADLFKKHKRTPLGIEACSTNVHPAIRIGHEVDEDGIACAAYRIHDLVIKGGNVLDGRKAKGITYRAEVS